MSIRATGNYLVENLRKREAAALQELDEQEAHEKTQRIAQKSIQPPTEPPASEIAYTPLSGGPTEENKPLLAPLYKLCLRIARCFARCFACFSCASEGGQVSSSDRSDKILKNHRTTADRLENLANS